mgnify:CR=1 FL=1
MANLTTSSLLDNLLLSIQDTSATLRARGLNWLNNAIQDIAAERDWLCLRQSASLPVSDKSITKPADYGRLVEMHGVGTQWVLTDQHHLSDNLYYGMRNVSGMFGSPVGWVEDATTITTLNLPDTSDIILTYIPVLGSYADGDTMPFPMSFSNYFQRALLTTYYEFDMDERYAFSAQQKMEELKQLKHLENQFLLPRAAYTRRYGLVNTDAR